jgi:predicted nucleotidyltransferase
LPKSYAHALYYTKGRRCAKKRKKIKDEINRIVDTLANTGIVSRILLFGSYAKGEETPKSDIDLCVLSPVEDKHPIDLMADFRLLLWDINKTPLDLLAYNQDNFYFHAKRPTSFEHEIAETGVLLYGH